MKNPAQPSPMTAVASKKPLSVQKLWSKRLNGYISDLTISRNGNALLAATLPNYERADGSKKSLIHYFKASGRESWKKVMPTQVKAQAISRDGALVVAATHDDQIQAFDSRGKRLWTIAATCSPILLDSVKKMICYHDDDAEPTIAFDIYDWHGKKLASYPIQYDVLALKLSEDERNLGIALTKGQVILFGPDDRMRWSARLPGEIVDLDVASGENPHVIVVYSPDLKKGGAAPEAPQKLALFGADGKQLAESAPTSHVDQVEFAADGTSVFAYGNGESGQFIGRFAPLGVGMVQAWAQGAPRNAHYTPMMYPAKAGGFSQAIIGFEQVTESSRQSFILSLDDSGALAWKLPVAQSLNSEEGAYLYSQSWSPGANTLAISTDDGSLGLFHIGP